MNPLVKIVIGVGAVIAAAIFATNTYKEAKELAAYVEAKQQLQIEFLERAAWVRAAPDAEKYDDEIRGTLKWYFGALDELYKRFPAHRGSSESYLQAIEAQKAAGKLKSDEYEAYVASYKQVREVFDLMREGKYAPAMTAGDATMRLDLLEFTPTTLDGQRAITGRFVLWGAQRKHSSDKGPGGLIENRTEVIANFQDVQLKMSKADKPLAEASFGIPAGPYVPNPERKIEDFPPMAYIGTFAFPLLPYEAEKAEIEAVVSSRSASGNEIEAHFKWEKELPAEWKLREGETWEGAAEEEREELAGPGGR